MSNTAQPNQAVLFVELLDLFAQARQLQEESTQILARQGASDVPDAATAPDAPRSPEETLACIVTLLAACSFENQVTIVKALALGIASAARTRAHVTHPPTA
jgi:hypothetical protein